MAFFFLDTSYIGSEAHHTPVWPYVNSTNYICSHPISKYGHILRLEFQYMNFENTQFICNKHLTFCLSVNISCKWWLLGISAIQWINKHEHLARHLTHSKHSTNDDDYYHYNSEHVLHISVLLSVKLGQDYLLGRILVLLKQGIAYACIWCVFLHLAQASSVPSALFFHCASAIVCTESTVRGLFLALSAQWMVSSVIVLVWVSFVWK